MNSILVGNPATLTQNIVYALPTRAVYIHSDTALQVSNVSAFTTSQAITANTPTIVSGLFVRCTTANAIVVAKVL